MEYLKIANSLGMWISCIPAVVLVIFQAALFFKKAWETGPKIGVTEAQMKEAAKSSFVASIGPSLVIVSGRVSLRSSVGGPLAWMRLSFIGSVMYELPAADRAATAAGCHLGTDDMTGEAFANCAWIMTVCCLGWILVSALFTDKMDDFRSKVTGGSSEAIVALTAGGGMGGFGYMVCQRAMYTSYGPSQIANAVAALVGLVVMWFMQTYIQKTDAKWAKQFGMTIAMFLGMIAGAIFLPR